MYCGINRGFTCGADIRFPLVDRIYKVTKAKEELDLDFVKLCASCTKSRTAVHKLVILYCPYNPMISM